MTNEEAINVLNDYDINFERNTAEEIAEAHEMAIKVLEEQPSEDCISRQAVLDALHSKFADGFDGDKWWNSTHVLDAVNRVPSATPQPKVGRWIGHREHCEKLGLIPSGLGVYEWCSNCGHGIDIRDWYRISHNYCPECGVKMQEVQQ